MKGIVALNFAIRVALMPAISAMAETDAQGTRLCRIKSALNDRSW
jgi:hypothetical protein